MSEAYKCDMCGEYRSGEPDIVLEPSLTRSFLGFQHLGFCYDCAEKIMKLVREGAGDGHDEG